MIIQIVPIDNHFMEYEDVDSFSFGDNCLQITYESGLMTFVNMDRVFSFTIKMPEENEDAI